MAKTWAEVVGSEGFQALSDTDKAAARDQYFDQVVAPKVPKEDLDFARNQFLSSTALTPPKAAKGEAQMKAWEPSALEEIVNVGKRGLLQAELTKNTLAFQAGLMDPATYAEKTRELNRKMGAAAPSGETAAGLERLQEANETGSISKVASELTKSKNWKALGALVGESAVATGEAIPFAIAGGLTAGPGGAAAATGATSFAAEFGSAIGDLLEKKGISPSDPVAIRAAIEDPKFMAEVRERGLKRGIPVAAFDALSAGFAGRFIRTLEKAAGAKAVAKASAKEAGLQVGAGMAGEAIAQAATGEKKPLDVFIEGLAELPGGIGEATSNIYRAQRQAAAAPGLAPEEAPPEAPPPAEQPTPAAPPVAPEAVAPTPIEEPAAIAPQVKPTPVDEMAARIAESTGMPIEDARIMAERRAGVEAEKLGATIPTTPVPTNRVEQLTQDFIAAGEAPERAQQLATQQAQEEQDADELATREAGAEQPVSEPDRTGVPVVGQPGAVPAPAGAGVPEPTGVVPAGPTPTGIEGGAEAQPPALTPEAEYEAKKAKAQQIAITNARTAFDQVGEYNGDINAALDSYRTNMADTLVEEGLKNDADWNSLLSAADRAFDSVVEEQKAKQKTTPVQEAQPEAPKRGRGRPTLPEEQKAASEAARKQQRLDANQAARDVKKVEAELQKAQQPLNEDDYDNLDDLANAQNVQRQQQQAAIRQLYAISRENKGKPGQRAAATLKAFPNQRFVQDAKTAYDYQKQQRASRSGVGAEAIGEVNPSLAKVTNGAQAITQILKTGNEVQKEIARRIRGSVGSVKVVVLEQGQELPEQLKKPRNLREWERARGLYIENSQTRERTVYLRGESFGADQGVNNVTLLHELLHAATNVKLYQALNAIQRGFSTDSKLVKVYGDLVRTMNSAGQRFNELARAGQLPEHISKLARFGNVFEDAREFVAYGMTDPVFQEFLMGAKGYEEDTSFFSRFVDTIRRFFNMGENMVNALTDLIVVTDKVINAPLTADMRLAEYGMPEQVSAQAKEGERSKAQITKDVSEAMEKVRRSRTAEEYAKSISALHAIKDPTLIIPVVKQAWAYADDKMRNAMAAAPTFDFLARWTKDTVPELTNTNVLLEKMSGMSHQLLSQVGRMSEDVVRAFKKDPALRKKIEDVVYTSTLAEVDPGDPNAKVRDARLDAAYQALGDEGKRIYNMLRDYYRDITEYYSSLLDKQIEDLDVNDETKKNLLAAVKTIYEGKEKITPYFPLVRRGDFWLSVGTGKMRQFHLFETKAERDNAAKAMAAERRTPLEELLDEKKFSVGNDVDSLRQASYQSSGMLRQIFDAIDNSNLADPDAREALKDAIYQVYLQAMPDQSFRRQFIHRKGITGFSTDLLRNINTTGAKMSVQLARIKYAPLLRNSISQARASVAPTPEYEPFVNSARNRVNAALTAGRKGDSVDQALESMAGVANKASYLWYLSGAASALIQPFSVYITGLPILTSQHGAKAAKELAKMVTYINQYGVVRQNADGTRSYVAPSLANNTQLPAEERRAIREMLERGVTQSSYASEVFGYKSTPTEALYFDPSRGMIDNIPVAYGKGKQFANVVFGGLMHNTERLSREAIYLASYRLNRDAGKSHEDAVSQAVIDTNEALGNYDMTNRPIAMQKPGGKILLQFQMFPLHTTLLLLTNFKRMLPLLNKEGKKEAAIKFFGVMGTAFSVAGLVGVPAFSAIMGLLGWAWKQFGKDDDWPEDLKSLDFETWFRTVFLPQQLGADLANLVEHGPLNAATGLDFASRLSLNNLWGRDTKETKTTRENVIAAAMSHAGPTASMILSLADGWDAWSNGDTKKAVEKLTPAAVRNMVIWDRMREEGIKDYRGAQLMSPEAISTGELFGQMLGFRPALSADLQEKNFKLLGIENRILNKRSQLLARLDNAYRNKDVAAYRDAYKDMVDFNTGFPSYEIDDDALVASLEKKEEQRGSSYRGIIPTEKNVPIIEKALVQSRKLVQERERKARGE